MGSVMRVTMRIDRSTRYMWVKTVNRIRHQLHLQHRPQPRVEIKIENNGHRIGVIEY